MRGIYKGKEYQIVGTQKEFGTDHVWTILLTDANKWVTVLSENVLELPSSIEVGDYVQSVVKGNRGFKGVVTAIEEGGGYVCKSLVEHSRRKRYTYKPGEVIKVDIVKDHFEVGAVYALSNPVGVEYIVQCIDIIEEAHSAELLIVSMKYRSIDIPVTKNQHLFVGNTFDRLLANDEYKSIMKLESK